MRIVFDLTTSARWDGPPVGIVNVQRQLARHAPRVEASDVEYVIYDLSRRGFRRLRSEVVEAILDGEIVVRFPGATARTALARSDRLRWIVRNPRRFVSARLGRGMADPRPAEAPTDGSRRPGRMALDDVVDEHLVLGESDVLVLTGAGWAGMDLRATLSAKETYGFACAAVCYDVIPWRYPELWPRGVAETVVAYYADLARVADLVMCISQTTAREYTRMCVALGIDCPELGVFRLGDTERAASTSVLTRRELEGRRIVMSVGALEPRKNHRLLYSAWDILCRDPSFPSDVTLVFVASASWMTDDLRLEIEQNPVTRDRLLIIDGASEEELYHLYGGCLLTLYPSLHEGWGLPVAESLSHGKICIASNRGSLPEISDLTVLIDPHDVDAWVDAIRRYVTAPDKRAELESRIRSGYTPTPWDVSARSFFEAVRAARPS